MKASARGVHPSASLAISIVALAISLSGAAMALPGENRVDSGDIVDEAIRGVDIKNGAIGGAEVREVALDPAVLQRRLSGICAPGEAIRAVSEDGSVTCETMSGSPSGPAGGDLVGDYPNPLIALDAVGADEIGADAVGFSEIGPAAFNADIAEQGTAFGIPNDAIQGFEVEDGTLTGADVNESTLTGVVRGRGRSDCCAIRAGILYTDDPYSAADPRTFIDIGAFELRSTAAGDPDKLDLCNPPGGVNFGAFATVYTGGRSSSATETRTR